MAGRSPGSQSVSQTVLFLAAFPLPGRAFVGNRARQCAPRIDPRSQPLTRNPGKSNAAGNRAHPCLQGPRAIQDTAHRTATCHRRQESAGLLFFLLELEAISTFVGLSPTKRQETGQAPWLHQGNRRTGSATPPAKDGSIPCERTPSYVCQGDLFPFRKLQRKKMMQISQRGRMSSVKLCTHCAGTQQGIAAMMMVHEVMLSGYLLPSRCRDRRSWLRFVIERRHVVQSLHLIPIGCGHDENSVELTSPLTPPFLQVPRDHHSFVPKVTLCCSRRQEEAVEKHLWLGRVERRGLEPPLPK